MGITASLAVFACICVIPVAGTGELQDSRPSQLFNSPIFQVRGDPEYRLSGVNLYRTTVADIMTRFGNPTNVPHVVKIKKLPGGRDYEWKRHGIVMRVGACDDGRDGETLCSVEVRGPMPDRELGVTGLGMKLGSTMADVRSLYFSRFSTVPNDDMSQVTLEWGYSIMYLHFDAGRVNQIILRRGSCPNLFGCAVEW